MQRLERTKCTTQCLWQTVQCICLEFAENRSECSYHTQRKKGNEVVGMLLELIISSGHTHICCIFNIRYCTSYIHVFVLFTNYSYMEPNGRQVGGRVICRRHSAMAGLEFQYLVLSIVNVTDSQYYQRVQQWLVDFLTFSRSNTGI